jgi:ABC-type branched-subunit amino acid transport system substrate-binding protein
MRRRGGLLWCAANAAPIGMGGIGLLLFIAACGGGSGSSQNETLRIGGLLSLTGGWASLGQTSQAAMAVAADDVNAYLEEIGSDLRVEIEIADTQLIPDLAADTRCSDSRLRACAWWSDRSRAPRCGR